MNKQTIKNRVCLTCGKSISHKKSTAKFCTDKCRYENSNKNRKKESSQVSQNIYPSPEPSNIAKAPLKRGAIVGDQKNNFLPNNNKVLDELYRSLRHKQGLLNQLRNYNGSEVITENTDAAYRWGKEKSGNKFIGFLSGAVTLCGYTALSFAAAPTIKKNNDETKKCLEEEIFWIKKEIKNIEKNNGRVSQTPAQLSGLSPISHAPKALINSADQINDGSNKLLNANTKADGKGSHSKAITIQQLKEIEHEELNFSGRWLSFIGYPAVVFFMIIHGKPGARKSTFAILFANYLAKYFGRALYISSEEGFAKTFKDKVERLGVDSEDLFVADSQSLENIKAELKTNQYNFVFVDSLDTLGIGPQEMKELRQLYPDIAFITISQSTKDGKMRGSNELIHDCDIVVQVTDGVAVTEKNRFLERGKEFEVV